VRCRRSGLIVEYRGKGLEAAADAPQGLTVARKVLRFLPCLLPPWSASDIAFSGVRRTRTWLYRCRKRARRCCGLLGAAAFFWEPPRSLTHYTPSETPRQRGPSPYEVHLPIQSPRIGGVYVGARYDKAWCRRESRSRLARAHALKPCNSRQGPPTLNHRHSITTTTANRAHNS
jgi:hypothetical protein